MNSRDLISSLRGVEGWLSDHEALLLYHLAGLVPGTGDIVEIGSWKGKSTICLGCGIQDSGKDGRVWAVDPHKGIIAKGKKHAPQTYAEFLKNIKRAGLAMYVSPIRKTSLAAAKKWKQPIRVLFIDGLHDHAHALEDYTVWSPYVMNGCIAFHDGFCGEDGVWHVINNEVFGRTDLVDMGTVGSIFYVVIGRPTIVDTFRVEIKKFLVKLSNTIHRSGVPWVFKKLLIHIFLRIFLITRYTIAVYRKRD